MIHCYLLKVGQTSDCFTCQSYTKHQLYGHNLKKKKKAEEWMTEFHYRISLNSSLIYDFLLISVPRESKTPSTTQPSIARDRILWCYNQSFTVILKLLSILVGPSPTINNKENLRKFLRSQRLFSKGNFLDHTANLQK